MKKFNEQHCIMEGDIRIEHRKNISRSTNKELLVKKSKDERSYTHIEGNFKSISKCSALTLADDLVFLGQEIEEGNIEYKLKLVDPTPERLEHLTTQMKWRLSEGHGEAFYEIGVEDDGYPRGLSDQELEKSIETLTKMAKALNAEIFPLYTRKGKEGLISEVMVREYREDNYIDVRIAVCGNVDAGKSTFIGVLTNGSLDNGRGKARLNVFNYKHEIESGRTSSISQQILGFKSDGTCVNYNENFHNTTWGDIMEESYKVISFLDLAGHEKYLKTTVSGMTGQMPDYSFLMVGANMGVTRMTKEHLGLSLSLKIPLIIVVTKIDMAPDHILKNTLADIQKILKSRGIRKMGLVIKTEEDFASAIKSIQNDRVVPIFLVSNVTGENLDMVRKFLNVLPPRIEWNLLKDQHGEVLVDETYSVTGVGTVLGGTVMSGTIKSGDTMMLGPDGNGVFSKVVIKSIHVKRTPTSIATPGKTGGFAIKKSKSFCPRKGMVLVSPEANPKASTYFEADVVVLYHSTTIHKNYQPVVQCLTVRQCAKIVHIEKQELLRTGDKAKVIFKFMYRPEYLKVGMRVIFREGRCKGMGIITKVALPEADVKKMQEQE